MAAVAGSKGKIALCNEDACQTTTSPSFQARLASSVLKGELSPEEAAERLFDCSRLREVGIDTNMVCNLSCVYCYLDDRPVKPGELSAEDWMRRLTPLAEDGCKLFAFIGKEPLLDEVAVTTLEQLNELRGKGLSFRTGMVTNGTRLPTYLDRLEKANLNYLDISLDGLPHINDSWRGRGTAERVLRNLKLLLSRNPQHDVFISSVLHQGNLNHIDEFVDHLFNIGLTGFFTSPVLKFTANEKIEDWAIEPADLDQVMERLLKLADRRGLSDRHQMVIDLPYKYAWKLMASGRVKSDAVYEDKYEVPYFQPDPSLPLFLKMNLFSYSFWKAIRITHDGTYIENMDLAAHPDYSLGTERWANPETTFTIASDRQTARAFHARFFAEHLQAATDSSALYDRNISGQHEHQMLALVN